MTRTSATRRRLAVAAAITALAPGLLAGCSGSASEPGAGGASAIASASPAATAGAATPSSDPVPSSTPSETAGAGADEYCALMLEGVSAQQNAGDSVQDALRALTNPDALAAGDMSAFHAAGDAILAYAPRAIDTYRAAARVVDDAEARTGLDAMIAFAEKFTVPVGHVFADATSVESASSDLVAVTSDADVRAAMDAAAAAAPELAAYTEDRCGYDLPTLQITPGGALG